MAKGQFIAFEGCDGSGKTTVSRAVYERLKEEGYDVIYTREPGGIEISEQIRNVILDPKNVTMDERTEALLYAASRRQHLMEKVLPALEQGKIVLSDRYVLSSLAYQGYARGIGIEEVWRINEFAIEDHMPDHTIFLDIEAKTGIERLKNRASLDRLDKEALSFHERVFDGYKKINEMYKDQIVTFDANRPAEEVIENVWEYLKSVL
ncbi:MAG: dTMP kinase [Erysipelotrichales bacterium]|nr:dTMP kinase [Erysipelotrichales bacterium]MBQ1387028.1 dTMP kinase [Erysipelotrichales bacterium]MBQ2309311.1 dTMP kinase [Erysipelotrichales bacterium]MBQ2478461.1 dTMP kinase [Erysipelotrichales bacterium]MBQ4011256.1 dTMP kinase [Erysipelotrichales bacterium]